MSKRQLQVLATILAVVIVSVLAYRALHKSPSRASSQGTTTTTKAPQPTSTTSTGSSAVTSTTLSRIVQARGYSVGDCVGWDQAIVSAPPRVVPCEDSHIFEVTGQADMPPGSYPTPSEWSSVDDTGQCYALAVDYLGGPTAPTGKFVAASLEPTKSAWSSGQHYAWCGVTLAGGKNGQFPASTGSARDASKGA